MAICELAIHLKLSACDCEEGPGVFANFLTLGSLLLVVVALPLSLFFVVKVVQVKHKSQLGSLNGNFYPLGV